MNDRTPMLNDGLVSDSAHPSIMSAEEVRDFYEAKITSGELMVVKTCKFVTNNYDANIDCDGCGWSICYIHVEDNPMKFCPGCGAKIIEP